MRAHFEHCLVLTYALPADAVAPFLPPGLVADTFGLDAFLAVALVQTKDLRPAGLPSWMGRSFFLSGYRVFTRFRTTDGRTLRGLRILRSDTNKWAMRTFGNVLTHYAYRPCKADVYAADDALEVEVCTPDGSADLTLHADLRPTTAPPADSPFKDLREARKFAGPLPFTFDYEPATGSMVVIEGQRDAWDPRPVDVTVERLTFFETMGLARHEPRLANAFYVADLDYAWKKGGVYQIPEARA